MALSKKQTLIIDALSGIASHQIQLPFLPSLYSDISIILFTYPFNLGTTSATIPNKSLAL